MKAWSACTDYCEYWLIVFADTSSGAKNNAYGDPKWNVENYIDIRVKRLPYLDDCENLSEDEIILKTLEHGWWWVIGDVEYTEDNIDEFKKYVRDKQDEEKIKC